MPNCYSQSTLSRLFLVAMEDEFLDHRLTTIPYRVGRKCHRNSMGCWFQSGPQKSGLRLSQPAPIRPTSLAGLRDSVHPNAQDFRGRSPRVTGDR
jgi:hypothetical protein